MESDLATLYRSLATIFERNSGAAIDIQTGFVERLQIVQAGAGRKPAFMAVVQDEPRRSLFVEIADVLPATCLFGFRNADIHHRYRPLRITDPRLVSAFERRSREELPTFWIGSGHAARIFEDGNPSEQGDDVTLGYPRCCAEWHYDCFLARGPEAFAEVTSLDGFTEAAHLIETEWRPRPGFFLPSGPLTAAVLRGNKVFPFVDHVACPSCLSDRSSATALINAEYSELANRLDRELAAQVSNWCARLDSRIESHRADFAAERAYMANHTAKTIRGRDAYIRHSRHQLKALGF